VLLVPLLLAPSPAAAQEPGERQAFVFLLDGLPFEGLLAMPEARGLASLGGAGLLSAHEPLRDALGRVDPGLPLAIVDLGSAEAPGGGLAPGVLRRAPRRIGEAIEGATADEVLVILATSSPSEAMRRAKDELAGIVMAVGSRGALTTVLAGPPPEPGSLASLTSDSTGRDGVVTTTDVAPTLASFLVPATEAVGIRPIAGPPPFELHERYLANRRMSVPVQLAAGLWVTLGLALSLVAAARRRWLSPATRLASSAFPLSVLPLALSLLLAGHLPSLTYATVVPFVVAGTGAGAAAGVAVARARGAAAALAVQGLVAILVLVLEAALGWTAVLYTFLGGTHLDGARFFGLPNVLIGLLLGAAVWTGLRLEDAPAAGVLVACALFAGWPGLGSNLGGAVTLAAAAGLWWGLRASGRLGMREAGLGLAAATVGALVTLGVHRWLADAPTHLSRFARGEAGPGLLGTFLDRLGIGVELIARNPLAVLPVLGVPVAFLVVRRPPERLAELFGRGRVWRDAALVTLASSVVAYVANDTGATALGLGFGTTVAMLLTGVLAGRRTG
jgi:hypothetical protein